MIAVPLLLIAAPFTFSLPQYPFSQHDPFFSKPYFNSPHPLPPYGPNVYNSRPYFSSPQDLVTETRSQAESLKDTLRFLATTPGADRIVDRVIGDLNNVCLNNIEQAIDAVEASAKLIENSGSELKQLIQTVESFQKLTDKPTVVREAANILRLLEDLIPKLAPTNPQVCGATTDQAFGSLRNLAALANELSDSVTLAIPPYKREELKTSSKVIYGVTSFLAKVNEAFSKFDKYCTSNKEYNIEAIEAIGDMMSSLADLFGVLGGLQDASEIRKQGEFTKKVVVSLKGKLMVSF